MASPREQTTETPEGATAEGSFADTAAIPRSPSVQAAADRLGDAPVSAWEFVRQVLMAHGEYGHGLAEKLVHDKGSPGPSVPPVPPEAWLALVEALFDPAKLAASHVMLHGRLLIRGLARFDADVGDFLKDRGFLKALDDELDPPFDAILAAPDTASDSAPATANDAPPATSPSGMLPDPAPLHVDGPADQDQLGRESFVKALAIRLNRVRTEYATTGVPHGFMMHLQGPWGSGKSSLLNLLRREIQPELDPRGTRPGGRTADPTGDRSWVVVDFNAWQNQRLDPPWWPLLDSMYRQAAHQLGTVHGDRGGALRLRVLETWRRLVATRRDTVVAGAIALALAAVIFVLVRPLVGTLAAAGATADTISGILALVGTVASFGLLASRSLLGGSVGAARDFMQTASDPTAWMTVHFRRLVDSIGRPVMVFVDDLDRCQRDYVVKLLEGIQTLLRDRRVMYVVAADRRWIHACFEQAYADFAGSVREPGRPLGSLFLEKAFQLSVAVPRLSQQDVARFWGLLVQGESYSGRADLAVLKAEVREELEGATTQEEILRTAALEEDDPVRAQVRRQVMVERLAGVEAEKSTEAFLLPFAPFLDGNPRAMKRLVNAYALHRDIALLGGVNLFDPVLRKQLALWTILALRWPLLEEFYLQKAAGRDPDESDEIADLLRRPSVRAILDGRLNDDHDVHAALDLDAIARLAGLAEGDAGAVA